MSLRSRIERIEQAINRARFGGGDGPILIRIHGGLDACEPTHATAGELAIERVEHESLDDFVDRAMGVAAEWHAAFLVIGGLPAAGKCGGSTRFTEC